MVRKHTYNDRPALAHVSEEMLAGARVSAEAAAARVREAEHADPAQPGWAAGLAAVETAARAAAKRVELLEQARAAQLERVGKREAAVKAAAGDLRSMAAALGASRDQVAAAAADHLRALAALATAVAGHNGELAEHRATLAAAGLRVRDDLVADVEHPEGTLEAPGLRTGGVDWLPVPAAGVVDHAMRQVFSDPQTQMSRFRWRPHETDRRPDGLRLPTLAGVGATLPPDPVRPVARAAPLAAVLAPRRMRAVPMPVRGAGGW